MNKLKITYINFSTFALLILGSILFVVASCSNMMDFSETPLIKAGDDIPLVTSDNRTIMATAVDLNNDGVIDGLDLDNTLSTVEVEFDTDGINAAAGTYPVDLDDDGNVDFYILIDYDGTIVANGKINNEGQGVIITVNSDGDATGIDFNNDYSGSDYAIGTYAPNAPGTPTVTSGNQQLTLNWSAVINTNYYKVSFNKSDVSGHGSKYLGDGDNTDTTCTVTGLTNGILYYVWVVATNANGDSVYSSSATGTPK